MYERKSTDENSNGEIISIAYTFKNFQARPFEWLLLSSGNELGKISGKVWNVIYPQRNLCKHCRQKRIFFRERYVYMLRIILKSLKKISYYALYEFILLHIHFDCFSIVTWRNKKKFPNPSTLTTYFMHQKLKTEQSKVNKKTKERSRFNA